MGFEIIPSSFTGSLEDYNSYYNLSDGCFDALVFDLGAFDCDYPNELRYEENAMYDVTDNETAVDYDSTDNESAVDYDSTDYEEPTSFDD